MARSHARTDITIWDDHDWRALSMAAQWLYQFLLSQRDTTHAGTIGMRIRRWSRAAAGLTPEQVAAALDELAATRFVVVDHDTEEVLVRTFIRNDGVFKQPRVMGAAVRAAAALESTTLQNALAAEMDAVPVHTLDPLPRKDKAGRPMPSIRDEVAGHVAAIRALGHPTPAPAARPAAGPSTPPPPPPAAPTAAAVPTPAPRPAAPAHAVALGVPRPVRVPHRTCRSAHPARAHQITRQIRAFVTSEGVREGAADALRDGRAYAPAPAHTCAPLPPAPRPVPPTPSSEVLDVTHQGAVDFGSLSRSCDTDTDPASSSDGSEVPLATGSTPDTWQPSARAWEAAAADRARLGADGTARATDKFRRYRTAAGRRLDDGAWVSWLANERPGTAGPADARGGSSLPSNTTLADRMAELADALADDDRMPPHPRTVRGEPRADVRGHASAIRESCGWHAA